MNSKFFKLKPLIALALSAPTIAFSTPITVTFKGTVTRVILEFWEDGKIANVGDQVNGMFSYETSLPNLSNLPNVGTYQDLSQTSGITLSLPTGSITPSPTLPFSSGLWLGAVDNSPYIPPQPNSFGLFQYFDSLSLNGIKNVYAIGIGFNLSSSLTGIAIPKSINNSDILEGTWNIQFNDGSMLIGSIDYVGTTSVPEPATPLLVLFGALVTGGLLRMRKDKRTGIK